MEIHKQKILSERILRSLFVYAIALAVFAFLHLPYISNILRTADYRFMWLSIILLLATAAVLKVNLKISKEDGRAEDGRGDETGENAN